MSALAASTLLLLLSAPHASAGLPAPEKTMRAGPPAPALPAPGAERRSKIGVMADAGVPDGAIASLVYRPRGWLRLHAGAGTNGISTGLRGGMSLVPFGVGPSLSFDAGHYFEGDASGAAERFGGRWLGPWMHRLGYSYGNAHLGLEFGSRRVTFFVRGGLSVVHLTMRDVQQVAKAKSGDPSTGGVTVAVNGDPTVDAVSPSFKLGLVVYLW